MDERELHARVSGLFERVVDLDPEERERALSEEEGRTGGPLVVQRLRLLLDVDVKADTERPLDPASLLGHEIQNYELVEVLDAGGMGVVYRARRLEPREEVAIKVLSAGPITAELFERFQTEAQLLASCDHPGIVRYRDSGELLGGRPYLIMDLVEGAPLSLDEPAVRAGANETVSLVIAAAAAVQHLHARPALHRDLKPANLLVARGADGPRPVLIDLGIARPLDDGEIDLTQGRALGTPAFMSPEQAAGGEVHAPTDVYGLGAVLHVLLTGHPPRGLDEVPVSDVEERRRRLSAPVKPPSDHVDAEVFGATAARRARRMRGDLDAIVVKALESDPKDRYESVEAFRADLMRWQAGQPVVARPIGFAGRSWRLVKRYPGRITLGAALVLFLAVTSFVTWRSLVETRAAKVGLEDQLGTTTAIREFLVMGVFQPASNELLGSETPVGEVVETAADRIGPAIDDRPAVAVGLRSALIPVFASMGRLDRAQQQVSEIRPLAAQLEPTHPQRMEFEVEVGFLATSEGRSAAAIAELRDVLTRIRAAEQAAPTLLSRGLAVLAVALSDCREYEESVRLMEEALRLSPQDSPSRDSLIVTRNMVVSKFKGPEAVLPLEKDRLVDLEHRLGPDHVLVMGQATNLAIAYLELGRAEEALPISQEAVGIANARLDPADLKRLIVLNNHASILSQLLDFEQAIPLRWEVYERRREVLGEGSPLVLRAAVNLASTLCRAESYDEALEVAEWAVESVESEGMDAEPDAGTAYQALGEALAGTGAITQALEAFDRALEIFRRAGNVPARLAAAQAGRDAIQGQ